MPDAAVILWGLLFGSVGFGFFIYGKNQAHPVAKYVGITLMVLPYFVSGIYVMVLLGLVLMSLPYFIKF